MVPSIRASTWKVPGPQAATLSTGASSVPTFWTHCPLMIAVGSYEPLGEALDGVLVPRPAYRLAVPYGAPARTACEACGTPVTWVGVRGCARCGARLGPRTWAMGLFGTVSFAAVTWALWPAAPVLPAALAV